MTNQGKEIKLPPVIVSASCGGSVDSARKARLNQGLKTLAEWAARRSEGDHDESTTLAMLERKVEELRDATNRAGRISAEEAAKKIQKQFGSRLAVLAD